LIQKSIIYTDWDPNVATPLLFSDVLLALSNELFGANAQIQVLHSDAASMAGSNSQFFFGK